MAELLRTHTSEELTEWMAYEHVMGPFGPERADLLHGIQTAALVNAQRGKGRKAKASDFIPKWDRGEAPSWQDMLAKVKQINRALGGSDNTARGEADGERTGGLARRHRGEHRRPD